MKHFKCEQAYIHRRWLVKKITDKLNEDFFSTETRFIYEVLSKKIKANYYCWTYLNWLIDHMLQHATFNTDRVVTDVVSQLGIMLYINPSDYCIFHTRLNLIRNLGMQDKTGAFHNRESESSQGLLASISLELELSEDLMIRYAEYTTVWNYRKYLYIYFDSMKSLIKTNEFMKIVDNLNKMFLKNINAKYLVQMNLSDLDHIEGDCDNWVGFLIRRDLVISNLLLDATAGSQLIGKIQNNMTNFSKFMKKFF